ncbi:MAG: ABC transporter ATP-binding protein [Patescibacteria group bacterium]|jgi:putative ABC transport system ATP-binding protein
MEPILKAENVRVTYNEGKDNEFTALNDISLEVYPEEYLIFFGPSGCGKSTMLYTLLGVQGITGGKVFVNGQDSSKFTEKEKTSISSQFFGIVFQNFNLIYSLNVADNITLPQVFINVPARERKEKGQILMERFGIATRAHNLPNNLSGGQQQRVAICRALMNDPQILLADEPVGNLDSESARVAMQTLSEINRKDKKTIILVTHDPNYLPFADRIYYFKDGKIEKVVKNDHSRLPDEVLKKATVKPDISVEEFKEMERLAHVRPSLSIDELKSWILTQYLLEEMSTPQMERLEKDMEALLNGALTMDEFKKNLEKPFSNGGVGLYYVTAKKYSEKIAAVVNIIQGFKGLEFKSPHDKKKELVYLLREFILNEFTSDLSYSQIVRLERAIVARLNQEVTSDEFVWLIGRPIADGGAHLRSTSAVHIGQKLEIILAALQQSNV